MYSFFSYITLVKQLKQTVMNEEELKAYNDEIALCVSNLLDEFNIVGTDYAEFMQELRNHLRTEY